jgi:nicotinate-nucleotide adenylyltransferase
MNLFVYGGAFDPPHWGHINLVKSVQSLYPADKFLIVPTGNAPHKSTATDFATRYKLAQAAFTACPRCEISDIENTPEISYTIDTLRRIRNSEFGIRNSIKLIIGSDMAKSFRSWKDHEQIRELCEVVVVGRYNSEFGIRNSEFKTLDVPVVEMSSSCIREKMSAKRYTHSINVAIMCGELSKIHGLSPAESEKAYIAGLVHDIAKKCTDVPAAEFAPDCAELAEPKLWHAITGARYVRDVFGLTDPDIINAIRFHTSAGKT